MIKMHGCKKCNGALLLDKDEFGWYEQCIQCGYTRDIPRVAPPDRPSMSEPVPVKVINDSRNLVELWKKDKLPSDQPIKTLDEKEGDSY